MTEQRDQVERLLQLNLDDLASILVNPGEGEQGALRAYFGEDLAKLRTLAEQYGSERSLGNVVILPGVMGSHLATIDPAGNRDWIWVNPTRLVVGQVERLRLAEDGKGTPICPETRRCRWRSIGSSNRRGATSRWSRPSRLLNC